MKDEMWCCGYCGKENREDEALEGFLGDGHWTPCTRTLAEFFCSHPEYKD